MTTLMFLFFRRQSIIVITNLRDDHHYERTNHDDVNDHHPHHYNRHPLPDPEQFYRDTLDKAEELLSQGQCPQHDGFAVWRGGCRAGVVAFELTAVLAQASWRMFGWRRCTST
jgi:hypothetical protein